jgi:hypothetical protein
VFVPLNSSKFLPLTLCARSPLEQLLSQSCATVRHHLADVLCQLADDLDDRLNWGN